MQSSAAVPTAPQGAITARVYTDIGGTAVGDLTNHVKFPNSPDIVRYEPYFELWATGNIDTPAPSDVLNNYGAQIVGYFHPPTTGTYDFYISADDNARLFLSTNSDPANKKLIAVEPEWNNPRDYFGVGRRPAGENSSATYAGTQWPTGNTITLNAGQAYYIEAIVKEGGGGDNLSVSIDGFQPIPGTYLSSFDKTSGPATVMTQPQNVTAVEGASATFRVEAQGTPPYTYQWTRNGTDIAGATNQTYTISAAPMSDNNAVFRVRVTNPLGSATSEGATLTLTPDTTPPTLVSAVTSASLNRVVLTFSEPVSTASAQNVANYSISGGVTVTSATRTTPTTVTLATSAQTLGTSYTLTLNNIQDTAATPNVLAPNTTASIGLVLAQGFLTFKAYHGIGGTAISQLTSHEKFPDNWDHLRYIPTFSTPSGYGDNYGAVVEGFIIPQQTGDYDFFLRSDDASQLFISANETPPDPLVDFPLAEETGCCQAFLEPGALQTSWAPVSLVAGRRYAVLALLKEGGGGDYLQVAWRRTTDTTAAASLQPIAGTFLAAVAPAGGTITISQQPAAATVVEGEPATFSVQASASPINNVGFQWQRNGQNIAGATSRTYTTPATTLADNNAIFRVNLTAPGADPLTSAEVALTVLADTFGPVVKTVGAMKNRAGNWEVGIIVDEPLNAATVTPVANYTFSGGAITAARYVTNSSGINNRERGIVLSTSATLTPGNNYSLTVRGLSDVKGNVMTEASSSFVASAMSWTCMGRPSGFVPDAIAVGENGFNVISGGLSFWDNNDDITFVYEQVTGDFDKVARVEYADPSSQWARSGIQVREALNDCGEPTGFAASRYQNTHVNPTTMFDGATANNSWETNRRLDTGGATSGSGGGGTPAYPNAWVRLKREGSVIRMFRSNNATEWVELGNTDFGTTAEGPLPNTVYVGPVYGPENGNIPEALRKNWAVRIRNYGNFPPMVIGEEATLAASRVGNNITISWSPAGGRLQSAPQVTGPWTDVGTANPATVTIGLENRFYRVANP
jgi:hypothetical protein